MATKKKFYGKDFQKKMEELKGGHKGVELTKGNRLPHGYEIVKGADKTKDYSKGKKKIVGLKKGHRLAHGYETEKGAKNKKYKEGGGLFEENDISNAKNLGTIKFQDHKGGFHNFEVMETEDRLIFGEMTNSGFVESGYIEKDGLSADEVLEDLASDIKDGKIDLEDLRMIRENKKYARGGFAGDFTFNKLEDYENEIKKDLIENYFFDEKEADKMIFEFSESIRNKFDEKVLVDDATYEIIEEDELSENNEEDGEDEYAVGGRLTTNEDLIKSFLTTKDNKKVGNLLTKYNSETDEVFLINYSTIIAKKKKSQVTISTKKYSVTTTKIQNMIKRMAEQNGLIVKSIEEFANGGKIGLSKNERLVHGNQIIKAATKGDYSTDDVQVSKGYRLPHGYETTKRKRYDLGGNFAKENTEMVANQNKAIKHHTEELKKILDSGIDAPAWVVAKVGRAANDLSDVTHYLDGEKMAQGGSIEVGDKVKAIKEYGGKSGVVIEKRGSFVVVEDSKGKTESYHESNLVKKMADGGGVGDKYNLSFEYNPSIVKHEYIEQIVKEYTKDWRRDNDLDNASFYVMGLTKIKSDDLKKELKMEDVHNIEIEKSSYATGGGVNGFSKGDAVDYEGGKYKIGSFDFVSDKTTLVYLNDFNNKPIEDQKGDYLKVNISRVKKYATGGGVGYEILDDLKYNSYGKGGNMDSDEKMFCASIANRYLKVGDFVTENNLHIVREEDLKKAIEENMDSYSEEGKAIAKSVLSKI